MPRLRSPLAVCVGDRLQQLAIEAIIPAMVSDIVVDGLPGQVHQSLDLGFNALARAELIQRFWLPSACL